MEAGLCSSSWFPSRTAAASTQAWRVLVSPRCSIGSPPQGCSAPGMIGDPDAYTAAINALGLFTVDDVVISTLPEQALRLAALET